MKKFFTLGLIAALSVATVAEAKRGGGFKVAKSKPSASQKQQKQQQQDADFNNTPPQQPINAAAQAQQGSRMNNFVTGAAAGYLLSNVLAPTEAQAQENANPQAVSSAQKFANPTEQLSQQVAQMPNVPAFKMVDPTDPNLIERNANYARYCLGGMQYLVSGSKAIVLVDGQNQPQRCAISQ